MGEERSGSGGNISKVKKLKTEILRESRGSFFVWKGFSKLAIGPHLGPLLKLS